MIQLNMPPRSERPKVVKRAKGGNLYEYLTSHDIVDSGLEKGKGRVRLPSIRCFVCEDIGDYKTGSDMTPGQESGIIFEKFFDAEPGEPHGILHWVCSRKCRDELSTELGGKS